MVELVDTRDLKSLGTSYRAGSIPAPGIESARKHWLKLDVDGRFFLNPAQREKVNQDSALIALPLL